MTNVRVFLIFTQKAIIIIETPSSPAWKYFKKRVDKIYSTFSHDEAVEKTISYGCHSSNCFHLPTCTPFSEPYSKIYIRLFIACIKEQNETNNFENDVIGATLLREYHEIASRYN